MAKSSCRTSGVWSEQNEEIRKSRSRNADVRIWKSGIAAWPPCCLQIDTMSNDWECCAEADIMACTTDHRVDFTMNTLLRLVLPAHLFIGLKHTVLRLNTSLRELANRIRYVVNVIGCQRLEIPRSRSESPAVWCKLGHYCV